MKFFHTADLHIGKYICEHSMLDDQKFILDEFLKLVEREKPDAIFLAGDIYDKSVPSAEAVAVLDDFLVRLSKTHSKVFVLSGNHDSAERIAFGGRLMENQGVFVSPVYTGKIEPVTLKDEYGEIDIWMLPFVRPAAVRATLASNEERENIVDYTSAIAAAIAQMHFTDGRRNILLAHQFVTGAERSDSEENVGGLDNVDASVFAPFDYVALGHIHKPQNVAKDETGTPRVRYSGTPLKYSLSEACHKKTLTAAELGATPVNASGKAILHLQEIPLEPLHDLRELRGTFAELISQEIRTRLVAEGKKLDDYIYVKLTDENDIPDAAQKLRGIYPNLMSLEYDNERTRRESIPLNLEHAERKSPLQLFGEFFSEMNGREMNGEENEFVQNLIGEIWEDNR